MQRFFLLTLILFPVFLYGQTLTSQSVKTNIEQYAAGFPQEKMYLQFDKAVYVPGETIWFKAYLMQGIAPSTIRTNLYIVFADENGNVLRHIQHIICWRPIGIGVAGNVKTGSLPGITQRSRTLS